METFKKESQLLKIFILRSVKYFFFIRLIAKNLFLFIYQGVVKILNFRTFFNICLRNQTIYVLSGGFVKVFRIVAFNYYLSIYLFIVIFFTDSMAAFHMYY